MGPRIPRIESGHYKVLFLETETALENECRSVEKATHCAGEASLKIRISCHVVGKKWGVEREGTGYKGRLNSLRPSDTYLRR